MRHRAHSLVHHPAHDGRATGMFVGLRVGGGRRYPPLSGMSALPLCPRIAAAAPMNLVPLQRHVVALSASWLSVAYRRWRPGTTDAGCGPSEHALHMFGTKTRSLSARSPATRAAIAGHELGARRRRCIYAWITGPEFEGASVDAIRAGGQRCSVAAETSCGSRPTAEPWRDGANR